MELTPSPDASALRVLLYIDSIHCGGAQRQLCHLAIGLKDQGHQVWVAAYYPEFDFFRGTLDKHGIPFIGLRKASLGTMIGDLGQVVSAHRMDWVVSFLEGPGIYALLAKRRYRNFRLCVAERSANTLGKFSWKQRGLRWMYRWADFITTNSDYQAEILRQKYPRLASKIRTIRNCVGDEFLRRGQETRSWGAWDSDRDWLAVVGQIAPWKNLHGLIDGLLAYRQRFGTPPRIRWAGRPAEAFPDYVREQKNRVVAEGLTSTIEWLGNIEDVAEFLHQSSGLLHPSIVEGFPNAVCEAFAVGVPTVIGDISDARFLGGQGRSLLFDPSSAESIAEALHEFVTKSGHERQAMVAAGRTFAEQELRQDVMATRYLEGMRTAR